MNTLIAMVESARPNKCFLKGKALALVEGIQRGGIKNREDAIRLLFSSTKDPEQSLSKLLRRCKQSMMWSMISSFKARSDLQRVYNEINAGFATVMVLLGGGERTAAIDEARRIYTLAKKYERIHIASALALKLSKHYIESNPDSRLQRKFAREASQYAVQIQQATRCNACFTDALMTINNRSSYTDGVMKKLEAYTATLEGQTPTCDMVAQYYILLTIKDFADQDYARAALTCTTVLEKYGHRVAFSASLKTRFLSLRAVAATAARQYEKSEDSLLEALDLTGHSLVNWQVLTYYRALNALHEGNWFKAQRLQDEASRRKMADFMHEHWAILNAYLYILNGSRFRLGRFFNETVEASQDKAGLNVNILVADLLVSLQHNRDRFIHRIEAIRNYRYRYLRGKANERVCILLDLIFQIPKHDFDWERIDKATTSLRRKLGRRSLYANHNLEIEIVPYEVLWDEVIGTALDEARRKKAL